MPFLVWRLWARARMTLASTGLSSSSGWVCQDTHHRRGLAGESVGAFGNGVGLAQGLNRLSLWHTPTPSVS